MVTFTAERLACILSGVVDTDGKPGALGHLEPVVWDWRRWGALALRGSAAAHYQDWNYQNDERAEWDRYRRFASHLGGALPA